MPMRPPTHHQRQLSAGKLPQLDALRGTAHTRGYDYQWNKLRGAFIRENPVCVFCGRPAEVIDHIRPIAQAPELRLERSNLRAVCVDCHAQLTANLKRTGRNEMPNLEIR